MIDAPVENAEQQNVNDANGENNQRNEGDPSPSINSDGENSSGTSVTSVDQDDNNRLPNITLFRTFILSFFSSLIPETPAV